MKVKNDYGIEFDFDFAVSMMDDEIREKLHNEIAPCSEQEFFDAYAAEHEKVFCEEWELAKKNPTV